MSQVFPSTIADIKDPIDISNCEIGHHEIVSVANNDFSAGERSHPGDGDRLIKKMRRKLDFRLLPVLTALYTMALVDRTNIGSARIAGLDQATGLNIGKHASITILVFYIGYIIFEIPSNMIIRKLGPAIWLSALAAAWGFITLSIGFVQSWKSLAVCRVLLGVCEAGLFPGCLYLMASWYDKFELQKRIAVFFMTGSFLSSFANILCLGLTHIAKHPEKDGWKYIFIVQGGITVLVAVLAFFMIVDFPSKEITRLTFLSAEEVKILEQRLTRQNGTSGAQRVNWHTIKVVGSDWKVWSLSFIYMAGAAGVYGLLLFLPIVLRKELGYSQTSSYLLAAPPAAVAVLFTLVVSITSDRYRIRAPFVLLEGALAITGLCMMGFLHHPTSRYIGSFLGSCGSNGLIITAASWQQNNVRGDANRSVLSAIQVTLAGMGGIYSALVFRQQDSPHFRPGLVACCALVVWSMLSAMVTVPFLIRANRKADRGEKAIEGDLSFRYTL